MREINLTFDTFGNRVLALGSIGENLALTIKIDCSTELEEYPGSYPALTLVNANGIAYPGDLSLDNGTVIWQVLARDVTVDGRGSARLDILSSSGVVVRTTTAVTVVASTIVPGTVPDPIEDWLDEASATLLAANQAVESALVATAEAQDATTDAETAAANANAAAANVPVVVAAEVDQELDRLGASATTLDANAQATAGVTKNQDGSRTLNLGIPRGKIPNFTIGTVTSLDSQASAEASITGDAANPVLNLGIPRGIPGEGAVSTVNHKQADPQGNVDVMAADMVMSSTDNTPVDDAIEAKADAAQMAVELQALSDRIGNIEHPAQTAISIPFSFPVSAWTGSSGNYTATFSSTSITSTSLVLTPNITTGFQYLPAQWSWTQISGGVTFTVPSIPSGAIAGTIPVIDSVNGIVPVLRGGTGASTPAAARANLGIVDSSDHVPITLGGTGAGTLADAKSNLGISSLETAVSSLNSKITLSTLTPVVSDSIAASSDTAWHSSDQLTVPTGYKRYYIKCGVHGASYNSAIIDADELNLITSSAPFVLSCYWNDNNLGQLQIWKGIVRATGKTQTMAFDFWVYGLK